MATIPETLRLALQHHQAGRLPEAEALYRQILSVQPNHADALHLLGAIAHQVGKHEIAVEYIARAIALNPAAAEYHNNMGTAYKALGKLEEAVVHYRQTLAIRPAYAMAHNNLGLTLGEQDKLEEAVAHYRQALALQPDYAEAYNNLGNVLKAQGKLEEAVTQYRQALTIRPVYPMAHNNLGVALSELGKLEEAVVHYRQALTFQPAFPEAYNNLGNALREQGKLEEAVAQYLNAIALKPAFVDAYNNLGLALQAQGKHEEAVAHYQKALVLKPAFAEAHRNMGKAFKDQGRVAEAAAQFERAFALQPDDGLRLLKATLLPVIPESMDHLLNARRAYERQLSELLGQDLVLQDPSVEVGATNFYLAYQGCNDRDLQQTIARLYEKACPALAYVASRCRSRRLAPPGDKIKVGFLSKFFLSHTIGRLTRGLIAQLDRRRFSVSVFLFPQKPDQISEFIVRHADRTIVLPAALPAARELIAQEDLDVLFYPDIGMDPFTYFLAFSRLASVQCVTWGHPDTTGIPAIDYFVSSEHLEPEGADLHYTERLVRLAQLPTYYYRSDVPPGLKTRSDFSLEEKRAIYLCPQSLFKLHPDFDEFVAGVLRAHPQGQAVFIDGNFKSFTELIMRRFRSTIPDVLDRIRVLPRQNSRDFTSLLSVVDVILDPVKWSGGSTTYEALSVGTPIVTMPSEFMRGRVTYGCYKQMGVLDCVASTKEEYVKLAVRLGTDAAYRAKVKARLLAANAILYENGEAVRELERFFEMAVGNTRCATVEGS